MHHNDQNLKGFNCFLGGFARFGCLFEEYWSQIAEEGVVEDGKHVGFCFHISEEFFVLVAKLMR